VACNEFDGQVVRRDSRVNDLLDEFVCVRLIQANAMDLGLFQFDYDLTFAAFFLNADKTIYGRFGSRSDSKDPEKDLSMEGFRKALEGALELHKQYPANAASLRGKTGPAPRFAVPEEYPSLKGKYRPTLDYAGRVAQSCIHCHQVGEAERHIFRSAGQPFPATIFFPWPSPEVIGLSLDPKERARVRAVTNNSPAALAGLRVGDEIVSMKGQPILSIADVQWVLHQSEAPAMIEAQVRRGRRTVPLTLSLPKAWREQSDISWRVSTWDLRRIATGGLVLENATVEERRKAGLGQNALGLRVQHVGQYGEHAAAKRAGFQPGDLIVRFDGRESIMTESALIAHVISNKRRGESVPVTVLRNGREVGLMLPIQ
jgi:serine protease Do